MLFNSPEFLIVFLPVALLVFLALQRMGQGRLVIVWLILVSLFFYGWWNPRYLLLLAFSGGVNYSLGLALSRSRGRPDKFLLPLGILFNLGLLAYFKYANFFLGNIGVLFDNNFNFEHIILPLAISFYTFQQITYLVDTRKGLTEPHGFLDYCLFVSFFPQLIAGPIVHHGEMLTQFRNIATPGKTSRNLAIGYSILVIGLFKKVVIADSFAQFSTPIFNLASGGQALYTLDALAGIFSYAFQLYFDFSGYSDMAIGLACLFGIKLPVNFFSPYRAQNISDFWRMWHATLSRFLRDYVYSPLGGFLCSPGRQRFNLFTTMFVGGVWHGAGWTFVVYGLCHGIYTVIHQLWRIRVSGPLGLVGNRYYRAASQLLTFLLVVFTLALFRSDSLTAAGHLYTGLWTFGGAEFTSAYLTPLKWTSIFKFEEIIFPGIQATTMVYSLLGLALVACWFLPSTYQLFQHCEVAIDKPRAGRPPVFDLKWRPNIGWALFIALLALISSLNLTTVSEFLYFQF